jgi:outer membrane protein OmpA-like peptidoglycan-associated protein
MFLLRSFAVKTEFAALLLAASLCLAQDTPTSDVTNPSNPTSPQSQTGTGTNADPITMEQTPHFKVSVVERTTTAINYHSRSGATTVNFRGTELMPKARGEAKVESKQGYMEIEVEFDDMDKPSKLGSELMTYVLWAVTPQGRAQNLGEVRLNGTKGKLDVTTELQAFGMIVTAEPYYAVTQPSNLVVMENIIRKDTVGATEVINAKYELLERGGYVPTGSAFNPVQLNPKVPLDFYMAQNAMRIAQLAQADKYATSTWDRAVQLYKQAEEYSTRKYLQPKPIATASREAIQTFEEARLISLRRQEEESLAQEREAARARTEEARRRAEDEAARRAAAETQAEEAARRREEAVKAQEKAQRIAEEQRRQAEEAALARQQAETAQQAALAQQQQAEAERQRAMLAAQQAEQQRLQAEREKEEMRARLLQQLNTVLETRDTQRGLIVNMSDVLFDTGKSTLRPGAREKLAKISGIVLAYPGLKLEIEGHTDSVGSDAYNQRLSEKRAQSVRDYLIKQGVTEDVLTAMGLGESQPVASNNTAAGRQQNRRVEMVVSGEVIGTKIGTHGGAVPATAPADQMPQSSQPLPQQPEDPSRPKQM